MGFTIIDYVIVALYLFGVSFFGIKVSGKQRSPEDYFLGSHKIPWWAVLFSVVATETSTLTFISIPAVAYSGNLTFLQIAVGYILGRIAVSLFFLPKFYKGEMTTAYQYLGQRFSSSMRNAASTTFMITRLLADGVRLFASAIPVAIILRLAGIKIPTLSIYFLSILIISTATFFYTFLGGIKAVVWMDVVQMGVYIGGAVMAASVILARLPQGLSGVITSAQSSGKLELLYLGFDLNLSEFFAHPYTLITAVIGGAFFSVASHGTDQLIVQRLLSTRSLKSSQKALTVSGLVVFAQYAFFMFIGLLLFSFYAGKTPAQLGLTTHDEIFAKFIVEQMPPGFSGLIIAAILAAAMSTLSSSINSLASATTMDIYKPYLGKNNTVKKDLRISRIITGFWGLIIAVSAFIFAIIQLKSSGERPAAVEIGLGIASYTYGGLLGVFTLGMLFRNVDRRDALIGFFSGLTALLFLVKGPAQQILPGQGLSVAWTLYVIIGGAVVVLTGNLSHIIRKCI